MAEMGGWGQGLVQQCISFPFPSIIKKENMGYKFWFKTDFSKE